MNHALRILLPMRKPLHRRILLSCLAFAYVLSGAIAESNNA